jgi:Ni,Fe-hydrogenase maturation factor
LLRDFSMHGEKAIAKVRRTQPAAYLKILALLVPREHKVEHSNPLKELTDEQLERALEVVKAMIAERDAGRNAKVIEHVRAENVGKLSQRVLAEADRNVARALPSTDSQDCGARVTG